MKYPKITVVTPSFNQGEFIEETILSILDQEYPNLEYIIMDGGSTDETVEIIEKYEDRISYWRSEPDGGQAEAIAEGFSRSTGEILAWLNSDDRYENRSLWAAAEAFQKNEELDLFYGDYTLVYPDGGLMYRNKISYDYNICLYFYMMVAQPASFWSRRIYDEVGGVEPEWRFVMDLNLFLKMGQARKGNRKAFQHVKKSFALFRVHESSKSVDEAGQFKPEQKKLKTRFVNEPRWVYKSKQQYYRIKTAWRFLIERGKVPLSKPPGKY
jgi:glycosyltransferase involved in cell wall biosynthesis